jgi:hypothetical protein
VASQTITNSGGSNINGNIGLSPGSDIVGFPPGLFTGVSYVADAVAVTAAADALTAYNVAAGLALTQSFNGVDLGGKTLSAGVYKFSTSASLNGALTLTGSSTDQFIFKIGTTLIAGAVSPASVVMAGGAQACNVFWQVGSSATLESGTTFGGNILALQSISLNTGASNAGGLYALNGAVTLLSNNINAGCTSSTTITSRSHARSF